MKTKELTEAERKAVINAIESEISMTENADVSLSAAQKELERYGNLKSALKKLQARKS